MFFFIIFNNMNNCAKYVFEYITMILGKIVLVYIMLLNKIIFHDFSYMLVCMFHDYKK